jgi:ribosomal protein S18 acetylase RimI-like enzyme
MVCKCKSCAEFPLRDLSSCDFQQLKQSHTILPIGYDNDFFIKVCGKEELHFGLCAEGRSEHRTLAGFATARQVGVYALCYNDRRALEKSGIPVDDVSELVYVLTIGVDPEYRRRRLAHSLMQGIVRVCSSHP